MAPPEGVLPISVSPTGPPRRGGKFSGMRPMGAAPRTSDFLHITLPMSNGKRPFVAAGFQRRRAGGIPVPKAPLPAAQEPRVWERTWLKRVKAITGTETICISVPRRPDESQAGS